MFAFAMIGQFFVADVALAGASPVFNNDPADKPLLRLKNITKGDTTWQKTINASAGDQIAFDVYYHNTVDGTVAPNTKIRIDLEKNANSKMDFRAYLVADNTTYITDAAYINIDCDGLLLNFDNTAKWYPNQQTSYTVISTTFPYDHSVLANVGSISGGWSYQGNIIFQGTISGNSQAKFNDDVNDKDTLRVKNLTRGDTTWQNSITANPGDKIGFDIYYHNTGACSIAKNTKAKLNFPTTNQNQISVTGYLSADNAATVYKSVSVNVNGGSLSSLTFDDIALWYPRQTTVSQNVNTTKSYSSIEALIGNVVGTCEEQGHMVFEATLSGTVGSPNLTIAKTVKNVTDGTNWTSSVNANPGERVSYKIDIYSNGQTAAQSVILKDTLPSNMTYGGNLYIDGVYSSYSASALASGISLGTINAGSSKSVVFDADLYADNYFSVDNTLLTNYAYALASNVSQKQSPVAQVNVQKTVITSATFALDKLVRNITRGEFNWVDSTEAYPGEVVDFSLKVTNTGNTVATGISVKDTLPVNLTYYDNVKIDGVVTTGNILSGIYLGDLAVGAFKTVTFQAIVASSDHFNFGYTPLINTGTAYNSYASKVDSATVTVNKKAVEGAATEVNTGMKDGLMNYLLLPALLAIGLIALFKDSLFKFDQWLVLRGSENRNYRSQRMLDKKINQIRGKENIK